LRRWQLQTSALATPPTPTSGAYMYSSLYTNVYTVADGSAYFRLDYNINGGTLFFYIDNLGIPQVISSTATASTTTFTYNLPLAKVYNVKILYTSNTAGQYANITNVKFYGGSTCTLYSCFGCPEGYYSAAYNIPGMFFKQNIWAI